MIINRKDSGRQKNYAALSNQEKRRSKLFLSFIPLLLSGVFLILKNPDVTIISITDEWPQADFSSKSTVSTMDKDTLQNHLISGSAEYDSEKGRAFYTFMGLPTDFENSDFLNLVFNAIEWPHGYSLSEQEEKDQLSKVNEKPGSYQRMDYGPVLSESIHLEWPEKSLVRKGLAIRLPHDTSMIFDTDLVGFVAGTAGGWLDISNTDYTSYKGSEIASLEGRQVFGSSELAGWAKDGNFKGGRKDGMGKLPDDWAQYKGYYKSNNQVVLSYRVGTTDVLELAQTIKHDKSLVFMRTLQVEASDKPLKALVTELREGWTVSRMKDHEIMFETGAGDTTFAVGLVHAPGKAQVIVNEGRIELHIPPAEASRTLQVVMAEMPLSSPSLFEKIRDKIEEDGLADFPELIQGGSAAWEEDITLVGALSMNESGYVMDRIPIPFDNPWGSWMRFSGLDFFKDGTRAVVTTWNGDVWIVSGIDESLENVTWRRFASGLFYPMGVAIVDDEIFVTERSQLTRLHDLNGNGEADYYENFNNDGLVHPMAHSLGLEVDSNGWFYFFKNGNRVPAEVPQHGALMRISPDGSTREVYARGFRGANTIGIAGDMILTGDQEGNWVPVDRIDMVKPGGFYGDRRHWGEHLEVGDFEPPVVWTPQHINNSSGSMTFAQDPRWGPLSGQWLLGSYGQARLLLVLTQKLGEGKLQGGVVELPIESKSGLMRGKMNPGDGQLYVVGLRGFTTLGEEDGSFERIRYTGGKVYLPIGMQITPEGIEIEFTEALDRSSVRELQNYSLERWEYIYSHRYGSPDMSLENPGEEGRDPVDVASVEISDDGRKIFLEIPDMRSVMQMKIAYNLMFEDGHQSENTIYSTMNWLSEAEVSEKPEWQQRMIARHKKSAGEMDEVNETDISAEKEKVFVNTEARNWFLKGKAFFQNSCSECHINGVAPSFNLSEWAAAPSPEGMIRILLNGKHSDRGIMPPFSWVSDEEIASVISYIRMNWHSKQELIQPSQVEQIRRMTEGRTSLWTEEELKDILD